MVIDDEIQFVHKSFFSKNLSTKLRLNVCVRMYYGKIKLSLSSNVDGMRPFSRVRKNIVFNSYFLEILIISQKARYLVFFYFLDFSKIFLDFHVFYFIFCIFLHFLEQNQEDIKDYKILENPTEFNSPNLVELFVENCRIF